MTEMDRYIAAADALAKLTEAGECPWRDDSSQYREWHQVRTEAAATYRAAREAITKGAMTTDKARGMTTPQQAAQIIIEEVLQKPCPDAAKTRAMMIEAAMSQPLGGITRSQRWAIVNDALRALAKVPDTPEPAPMTPVKDRGMHD